jgi:hypothetical protein
MKTNRQVIVKQTASSRRAIFTSIVRSNGQYVTAMQWYTLTDASASRLFALLGNCDNIVVRDDYIQFSV